MQSLERRHIPALSDECAHLVENVNAPTLVGENVVATTGAISQGYGCLPHVDKQSLLVETIAFHRPPPKQWMFVIPGARIIIDLKKAPGILYVPANVYHATLPSGSGWLFSIRASVKSDVHIPWRTIGGLHFDSYMPVNLSLSFLSTSFLWNNSV